MTNINIITVRYIDYQNSVIFNKLLLAMSNGTMSTKAWEMTKPKTAKNLEK